MNNSRFQLTTLFLISLLQATTQAFAAGATGTTAAEEAAAVAAQTNAVAEAVQAAEQAGQTEQASAAAAQAAAEREAAAAQEAQANQAAQVTTPTRISKFKQHDGWPPMEESCFETPADHQAYTAARETWLQSHSSADYVAMAKAHVTRQLAFDFKYTQAAPGEPIILDATGSRVPSGLIFYSWSTNKDGFTSAGITTIPPGKPGSSQKVRLTLLDDECGINYPQTFTVISK